MRTVRFFYAIALAVVISSTAFLPICLAETKVIIAEASYTMGDGETPSFAEAQALQKAKQAALEQAGTYVESYTKVQNYQLTADEIQTIAGGVLQVEILDKKRELIGDGLRHYVKINATVTTDEIVDLVQRVKGNNVAEEYKKLQEDYAKLSHELESWKQRAAKTPQGPERDAALDQIKERERAVALVKKREAAWQMEVHECDSRPVSDACMTLLRNAGFSPVEVLTWANDVNQAAKAVAHKLLKSHGCEAKSVTTSCLRNLKDAGFTDYQNRGVAKSGGYRVSRPAENR